MKILKNAVIKDRYEVIVVGAGIGGITAAAMLAKKGVDVLCIEQHYMPGGCCGSIRRQGITLDVGATVLYGFGEKGMNTHRFVMNELEEEIDMIPRESMYNMHIGDKTIVYWRDFNRFFKQLVEMFPNQKNELTAFYDELYKLHDIFSKVEFIVTPSEMSPVDGLKMVLKNPAGIMKVASYMTKNATDLFKKYFVDPEIIAFFDMLTRTFFYVDSIECPAINPATMFTDNHEGGAYYPIGSPQMLSNKLEKSVERWGGQILYRNLVDEILISKGKAYGVRLSDGTEIMAESVISDGTVWNLYGKLVKPEHIKPERMKWAQELVPCHSNMILYIGLDAKAMPQGTLPMEIFIEDMTSVEGHGITVYLPTLQDPGVSPPGKLSVTVTAVSPVMWPRPWEAEYQSDEYKRKKEEEAGKILDRIEKYVPDFRKHIIFMEIGTPATVERYTLKNWGNVGGPKSIMIGKKPTKRLCTRSDWKNLYLCGDSTEMGLGVLPSTMSAVSAANVVLKKKGLPIYKARKFGRQYVNLVKAKPWIPVPPPEKSITEESAKRIAKECQHCEKAGCMEACPAEIDLVGFFRRIESGNFTGAAQTIHEMNPFAEICGYICPAEKLCEKKCNRHEFDTDPVRIKDMHKWVCGHASDDTGWQKLNPEENGFRVAVVGAGPAGLTCAHYLSRLGYQVDVMDKAGKTGGILTHAIPEFRLPGDVVKREIEGLSRGRINFRLGRSLGVDFKISSINSDYDAVFVAPGLWAGRSLDIPGIEKARTVDAFGFLKSYCKSNTADVPGKVIVIGGGSVAADSAIVAKKSGAESVTLVCLESAGNMPCTPYEESEMKNLGIKIENCLGPEEILSDSKISFSLCKSVFDETGRFCPELDRSKKREMDFGLLIIATGQTMEPSLSKYLNEEFGTAGLIEIDKDTMQIKNRPGIFAGGDIVRGSGTVVQSVGDGRRAAMGIDAYIKLK